MSTSIGTRTPVRKTPNPSSRTLPALLLMMLSAVPLASAAGPADFLVSRLSLTEFKATIHDLAAFETRYWNKPGNDAACAYLQARLASYGYTVTTEDYVYNGRNKFSLVANRPGADPNHVYIVGAHLDSYNANANYDHCPGADDDGSGIAAVVECARVFARARPAVGVRFICWNNEETGLNGSAAYVANHWTHQGVDEAIWDGMIQLDMILYDHGPSPVPNANVDYNSAHTYGGHAIALANAIAGAMATYGSIPAEIGSTMTNTDSQSFWSTCPAISIRENKRLEEIGNGSNPNWHQTTDRYETYSERDYNFGFEIVKMLTGGVAELSHAAPLGDMNCDQQLDFGDINAFLVALDGQAAYQAAYPDCDWLRADCNGDGTVDAADVIGFVHLLSS